MLKKTHSKDAEQSVEVLSSEEIKKALQTIGVQLSFLHNTISTDGINAKPDDKSWVNDHTKELEALKYLKTILEKKEQKNWNLKLTEYVDKENPSDFYLKVLMELNHEGRKTPYSNGLKGLFFNGVWYEESKSPEKLENAIKKIDAKIGKTPSQEKV